MSEYTRVDYSKVPNEKLRGFLEQFEEDVVLPRTDWPIHAPEMIERACRSAGFWFRTVTNWGECSEGMDKLLLFIKKSAYIPLERTFDGSPRNVAKYFIKPNSTRLVGALAWQVGEYAPEVKRLTQNREIPRRFNWNQEILPLFVQNIGDHQLLVRPQEHTTIQFLPASNTVYI